MSGKIQVCRPYMAGNEAKYVNDAIATGWISSAGEYIRSFEQKFAAFVGCREGVACSNGTAAVLLALKAAGVRAGDRVVTPSFTMMGSVFPITMLGAIPVFVDCDADTWNMNVQALDAVKGPVKAVMAVHIYGHPTDMDPVNAWAKARGAVVIEDAAEAHGAQYKGAPVGSLSHVAAWSFFANKVITTGEGGMVTTNDAAAAERARYDRNLCFDKDPAKRFVHDEVGFNYRMTNIQAAIGLAQTEYADKLVDMRRGMAKKYLERLPKLASALQLPVEKPWAKNVYWMFGVVLRDDRFSAATVVDELAKRGVESRRFFCPGHMQPALKEFSAGVHAPVSEMLWQRGFYLPSSADLTDDEADRVVAAVSEILA